MVMVFGRMACCESAVLKLRRVGIRTPIHVSEAERTQVSSGLTCHQQVSSAPFKHKCSKQSIDVGLARLGRARARVCVCVCVFTLSLCSHPQPCPDLGIYRIVP